ncbi:hypothetical protein [Methylobacterium sp. J-090]|uniref:hypothetical protein n=1 Tax=Methylobacterium sp. J-090 TaxID=2836666 RepID=UPI001FB96473|nr:hypothetical protein [Methylobacterium sp. J-090]MCJ2084199.1 hypothetical protein [Methylobacterium sp. J-090]
MTERETLAIAQLAPVFAAHGVPDGDRLFVYWAVDTLMEQDCDHATAAGCVEGGTLGEVDYEDLLESFGRGHRRGRTWFRDVDDHGEVGLTRRGRDLLRALAAVNPDWQDRSTA